MHGHEAAVAASGVRPGEEDDRAGTRVSVREGGVWLAGPAKG
jgi:hypothetical protein